MKKIMKVVMTVMMAAVLLTGCGATKLSDAFDATVVEETAKEAIGYMNEGSYDKVTAMVRADLQGGLSAETIESAVAQICSDAGEFTEFGNMAVVGQQSEGVDTAVAIVSAKYENQNVQYTISFNTDMEIIGFYLK